MATTKFPIKESLCYSTGRDQNDNPIVMDQFKRTDRRVKKDRIRVDIVV